MDEVGSPRTPAKEGGKSAGKAPLERKERTEGEGKGQGTHAHDPVSLAAYIAGFNALLVVAGAVLYLLWIVLEPFRNPILWAIICSVTLRDARDKLVDFWTTELKERSLAGCFVAPLRVLLELVYEVILGIARQIYKVLGKKLPEEVSGKRTKINVLVTDSYFKWLFVACFAWQCYRMVQGSVLFYFITFCIVSSVVGTLWHFSMMRKMKNHKKGQSKEDKQPEPKGQDSMQEIRSPLRKALSFGSHQVHAIGAMGRNIRGKFWQVDAWLRAKLQLYVADACVLFIMAAASIIMLGTLAFFTVAVVHECNGALLKGNAMLKSGAMNSGLLDKLGTHKAELQTFIEAKLPDMFNWVENKAKDALNGTDVRQLYHELNSALHAESFGDDPASSTSSVFLQTEIPQKIRGAVDHFFAFELSQGLQDARDATNEVVRVFQSSTSADVRAYAKTTFRVASAAAVHLASSMKILLFSGKNIAEHLFSGGAGMVRFGVEVINYLLQFLVFVTILYYFLVSNVSMEDRLTSILPLRQRDRVLVTSVLLESVRGVFLSAVKIALFNSVATWLMFSVCGIHFVYVSTLMAALTSIIPLAPPLVVSLPAVLQLAIQGKWLLGLGLGAAHQIIISSVDEAIMGEIPDSHPYLSALGIVGGMAVFEPAAQGAILGPLLVTCIVALYQLHREYSLPSGRIAGGGETEEK